MSEFGKSEIDEMEQTNYSINSNIDPKNNEELIIYVQNLLQNVQDKFQCMSEQIIGRIDEMGNRIDDLEKSISELMQQAGVSENTIDNDTSGMNSNYF